MTDEGLPTSQGGNITRPPELKFTDAGKPWCKFGLAVNPYVPKGQEPAETIFYEVVAFGSLATNIAECLTKGMRIVVKGQGKLNKWTGQDGQERVTKEIVAEWCGPDLRFASVTVEKNER